MDFRDLTYIQAIAKHQNITKAADALYVGQPTLSKFLKSLEADLGQKLFRRLGNKYVPTYAGERYLEKAEQLICTGQNHPIGRYAVPNPDSPYPKLDVSLLKDELVIMMLPGQRTRQTCSGT